MAVNRQRVRHKRDRLRQLQAFCHAARLESISRSAEYLALSKSAVAFHVRELEHELEAVLFERISPAHRPDRSRRAPVSARHAAR